MEATYFITGATGNVGARLIIDILQTEPTAHVLALVRGDSEAIARQRLLHSLHIAGSQNEHSYVSHRLEVLPGDVTLVNLGLSSDLYHDCASRVTHIVHAAATTQFNVPLSCARQTNYSGTVNVARFAMQAHRLGALKHFAYVSTAFVASQTNGLTMEDDHILRETFDNSYEQTKYEAEEYVRSLSNDLPLSIYRPSIVVGDSETGRIISLNVLYTPLRYILKGLVRVLPCPPDVALDIVPVDYVATAIHHLIRQPLCNSGFVYNLTAGEPNSLSIQQIVSHAIAYHNFTNRHMPLPMVSFAAVSNTATNHHVEQMLQAFMPYITVQRQFDSSNTSTALHGTGISVPNLRTYFDTLLDYCYHSAWGKRVSEAA